MELRLRRRREGGATVIEVAGEVELSSASRLREELARVCERTHGDSSGAASWAPHILVDLSGVTFIDSSGVGVLVGGLKKARELGGQFIVVNPQPRVRRVFEIAGLLNALPICASLDEAQRTLFSSGARSVATLPGGLAEPRISPSGGAT